MENVVVMNLKRFQYDALVVDFGYMHNRGWTYIQVRLYSFLRKH